MKSRRVKTHVDQGWDLNYSGFNPSGEKLRETLCTVGNGYFGTRGCIECERGSETHYPGTYLAGLYNRLPSTIQGKEIFNDDFVNCPNWLLIELAVGKGRFFSPLSCELLDYEQVLHMREAVLWRKLTFKDRKGRITTFESRRIASMANPHYAAILFSVTPVNYAEKITLRSSIDGTVINDGVPRYSGLSNRHLTPVAEGGVDDGIFMHVETNQSHIQIAVCAKHLLYCNGTAADCTRKTTINRGVVAEQISFKASRGTSYSLHKLVSIATSRDKNTASALDAARAYMSRIGTFEELFEAHIKAWAELWSSADIEIGGDPFAQKVIRLHIYHLLTTASAHNVDIDAGMPARGLHGEAYRGHIFWDSLFVIPFYFKRFPNVARAALMYRYRRLDAARTYARENGCEGAMFPWQSADDGQEETQVVHYNPVSGNWDPDLSSRQRHVNIAIFYNIWEYFNYTGDMDFLGRYGAEMILEITRFWTSIATFSKKDRRFHVNGVMGPDEFHEKYPQSDQPGINDNAYTNVMVVWLIERALEMLDMLPTDDIEQLKAKINFDTSETERWREIMRKMYVPITRDKIICQFEGYTKLKELDWKKYREKYGSIHRLDRLLKSEGDSPDNYKVSKQADALMLFFVLAPAEVIRILKQLGYSIGDTDIFMRKNYDYYEKRTSHGSTLSKVVYATICREMNNPERMWKWFREALESDIYDTQGGTTVEGIHCGVMAGTTNIITRVIAGIHFSQGAIDINPALPPSWTRLAFTLLLRNIKYRFEITKQMVTVGVDAGGANPLVVKVKKDIFK